MSVPPRPDVLCADTRNGRMRVFDSDDPIGIALVEYGEWAQAEFMLLARLVRAGDVVVDVGASVGTHALALARAVAPGGRVVALEPQPAVRELLEWNVRENALSGEVTILPLAASSTRGTARLSVPDYTSRHNSGSASIMDSSAPGTVEVQVTRLDDLDLQACSLVKLDVEGAEAQVLEGAMGILRRFRPLLYAECNSVERGARVLGLVGDSYRAWMHAPPAFNPDNFRKNPVNRFGPAQETNLLLVPVERADEVETLVKGVPHLYPLSNLDDLAAAFACALRFGEVTARPESAQALSRRVSALERTLRQQPPPGAPAPAPGPTLASARRLTRPVHVIVPIYNGFKVFEQLVESLFAAHPRPDPMLTFVFIDDASPDPSVWRLLSKAPFQRPDVVVLKNPSNRGFIGTVNRGLERFAMGPEGTDIVILNADTRIHGDVFAVLQEVATRFPHVASVTPLTNNGTIASLLNWPEGGELHGMLDPELVTEALESLGTVAAPVDLPSGVGFCMYMTKAAVEAVGCFDPIFGKGYGEENHWCLTAARKGFVNLLCTQTFVYHHGSQSFGDEVRRQHLERNLALLGTLHPTYGQDVSSFVLKDPLRGARVQAAWAVRRRLKERLALRTVLYVMHTDPGYHAGGTERHVAALSEALLQEGRTEVFQLFPESPGGQWVLRVRLPRKQGTAPEPEFLSACFEPEQLMQVLAAVAPEVDVLHVHHLLHSPGWMLKAPAMFRDARKILTLHDYYTICPSIRLIAAGQYCRLPDSATCNRCLRQNLGLGHVRIEDYRREHAEFLGQFDQVLTPSESARLVLERGFESIAAAGHGTLAAVTTPRIRALPNFLLEVPGQDRAPPHSRPTSSARRVAFLGAFSDFKGAALFEAALPDMLKRGWTPEIWGTLGRGLPRGVVHRVYRDSAGLQALARDFPVDVVVMPAVWPETFSYTTYEAVLDIGAPVVVGPHGNPAELVQRHGVGRALETISPEALLNAISDVLERREALISHFEGFWEAARVLALPTYLDVVYGEPSPARSLPPLGLLPGPSLRREPSPDGGVPLRYALIDKTNALVKQSAPFLHSYGKQFGSWLNRLRNPGK